MGFTLSARCVNYHTATIRICTKAVYFRWNFNVSVINICNILFDPPTGAFCSWSIHFIPKCVRACAHISTHAVHQYACYSKIERESQCVYHVIYSESQKPSEHCSINIYLLEYWYANINSVTQLCSPHQFPTINFDHIQKFVNVSVRVCVCVCLIRNSINGIVISTK